MITSANADFASPINGTPAQRARERRTFPTSSEAGRLPPAQVLVVDESIGREYPGCAHYVRVRGPSGLVNFTPIADAASIAQVLAKAADLGLRPTHCLQSGSGVLEPLEAADADEIPAASSELSSGMSLRAS